ncbi:MAG TPA: hypothetical protein VGO03_13755 [Acidimicrobiia bacterium]
MKMHRRARRLLAIGAVGTLTVAGLAAPAKAGPPGKWTRLTAGAVSLSDTPGMARASDGSLHVIYEQDTGSSESYAQAVVSRQGVSTAPATVLGGWSSLIHMPVLIRDGSRLRLVFSGLRSTNIKDPFTSGALYTALSTNGTSYTLNAGAMSHAKTAYSDYGADAVMNGTTPIGAFAFNESIYVHSGVSAKNPATEPDKTVTNGTCCLYHTALVRDSATGATYVGWSSNGSKPGLWVERVLPTASSPAFVPGSVNSKGDFIMTDQRVALAARVGGGLYEAYCVGYPTCTGVRLWKVGATSSIAVPSSAGATANVAIAPAPGGQMWVIWTKSNHVYTALTNTAATGFGAVHNLTPPSGTSGVYKVAGEASNGTLDIVINNGAGLWHQQVNPS